MYKENIGNYTSGEIIVRMRRSREILLDALSFEIGKKFLKVFAEKDKIKIPVGLFLDIAFIVPFDKRGKFWFRN